MIPSMNPLDFPSVVPQQELIPIVNAYSNEPESIDPSININQQRPQNLSGNLNEFRKIGKFCDVTLKTTDGLLIKAHKCVLSSKSAFFENMFTNEILESDQNIIYIKYITNTILEKLVDYMYTGIMVTMDDENVEEILNSSELLQLMEVHQTCMQYLLESINDKSCLVFKNIADARNLPILSRNCLNHALMRFDSVYRYEGFVYLNVKQVIEIIKKDNLHTEQEENVYRAIINWIKYDERKRKRFLPILIKYIRLPSTFKLYKQMKKERLIKQSPRCMRILNNAYKYFNNNGQIILSRRRPRNCQREGNNIEFFDLQEMERSNNLIPNYIDVSLIIDFLHGVIVYIY